MATLIPIGNSQGVRIPKPLIEQAGLERAKELELRIVDGGLLIAPLHHPRDGWAEAFKQMHSASDDTLLLDDADTTSFDDEEWCW